MNSASPTPAVVLLAEDETLVRAFAADALCEEGGFKVHEAASGDEAITVLHAMPGVSVLVTDVEMPGALDGFALARLVANAWPEMGIVVVTGRASPGPGDLPDGALFLTKPYAAEILIEAVRKVLAAKRAAADRNRAAEAAALRGSR